MNRIIRNLSGLITTFSGLSAIVLSMLSPVDAIEVNKKGFQLPTKFASIKLARYGYDETQLTLRSARYWWEQAGYKGPIALDYRHVDGSGVTKVFVGSKVWMYIFYDKFPPYKRVADPDISSLRDDDVTGIADNDCDGVFETRYHRKTEVEGITVIPDCYR